MYENKGLVSSRNNYLKPYKYVQVIFVKNIWYSMTLCKNRKQKTKTKKNKQKKSKIKQTNTNVKKKKKKREHYQWRWL